MESAAGETWKPGWYVLFHPESYCVWVEWCIGDELDDTAIYCDVDGPYPTRQEAEKVEAKMKEKMRL